MNAEEISSSIITASPQQAGQLVDVVVRAFISDPPSRWVFPDEQQYLQYFPQFVRALGGNAFTQGAALATADYSGAALWLAPSSPRRRGARKADRGRRRGGEAGGDGGDR